LGPGPGALLNERDKSARRASRGQSQDVIASTTRILDVTSVHAHNADDAGAPQRARKDPADAYAWTSIRQLPTLFTPPLNKKHCANQSVQLSKDRPLSERQLRAQYHTASNFKEGPLRPAAHTTFLATNQSFVTQSAACD